MPYAPDAFGRATAAAPFLTHLSHYPTGQLEQLVFDNGQITDIGLDPNRLWIDLLHTYDAEDLIERVYEYDDAGNLELIDDLLALGSERTLGYDGDARLISASGEGWLSLNDIVRAGQAVHGALVPGFRSIDTARAAWRSI